MTPAKYFYKRLRAEIRFQYNVIQTVADWFLQIYLGIPILLALIIWQVNMWQSEQIWINNVPLPLFLVLLAILLSPGSLRLYIQEADVLFLRQQKKWLRAIVHRGMLFSFFRDCLIIVLCFAIVSPFLIQHYNYSWLTVTALGILGLMMKENVNYAEHLLSLSYKRLSRSFIYLVFVLCFVITGSFFASSFYLMIVIDVLFVGVFLFLLKTRLTIQGTFLNDMAHEKQAKWRLASILVSQVVETKTKTAFSRRRPFLFKNSGIMFTKKTSVHRLTDVYVKLFLRNMSSLRFYLMLSIITIAFIIFAPAWVKWIGWIPILFVITDWLKGHVKDFSSHSFLQLWKWESGIKHEAGKKAMRLLLLPIAVVSGGLLGGLTFSWLGVVVMIFLGYAITFPVTQILVPRN